MGRGIGEMGQIITIDIGNNSYPILSIYSLHLLPTSPYNIISYINPMGMEEMGQIITIDIGNNNLQSSAITSPHILPKSP